MTGPMPYKIGFLLLPEFSYFGLNAAIQPLFLANWRAQRRIFEWSMLSLDGMPVTASNRTVTAVDGALQVNPPLRTLLVLASFEPKQHALDPRLRNAMRRAASFGIEVG